MKKKNKAADKHLRTGYKRPRSALSSRRTGAGNKDYQTDCKLAQEFFGGVNAPYRKMYIMDDMTRGLLESRLEEFSSVVHEIAAERGGTLYCSLTDNGRIKISEKNIAVFR